MILLCQILRLRLKGTSNGLIQRSLVALNSRNYHCSSLFLQEYKDKFITGADTSKEKKVNSKLTQDKLQKITHKKYGAFTFDNSIQKSFLVPRVASTEDIPSHEVQVDGLFAGYRPLFLGESSIKRRRKASPLDKFFHSVETHTRNRESGKSTLGIQDIIDNLRKDHEEENLEIEEHSDKNTKVEPRKPVIPWDASVSGIFYKDQSFKNVPKHVMNKLKPYKVYLPVKKTSSEPQVGHELIVMNVHNSKVDDKPEMVDFYNLKTPSQSQFINEHDTNRLTWRKELIAARKKYYEEFTKLTYSHKFLRNDLKIYKNNLEKLNRFLSKEFYKARKIHLSISLAENQIPLVIYVNNSIASRSSFRRILRSRIYTNIYPILKTILNNCPSEEYAQIFEEKVKFKIKMLVYNLSRKIPSVYFRSSDVDCLVEYSPIRPFKRMFWVSLQKRRTIFKERNINREYVLKNYRNYSVTRSSIRYMRYPISLYCDDFNNAFSNWPFYDQSFY
ncbi:hypothetical protein TBLA_0B08510 [Henningerozyma blattae CBS 6284]|uniref:Uncharacterized protein n=1 Tax=Henningerozyma blattae (strain ATCC 34711 / CBS 6284 / DSM 70876 / NBRC 10599 / NRRL Y-10934 / UCD 77-7) TaxID=1071380 RepID=I2GZW4_HENB6|nr:hypothetical protein TBLA_0B08510 [Tetrapisispora blattae CBS 6284]CCH59666.1 hypothetical protein TBLA_0B08510 [Tetrapisispora blattae CBS 6284]